ncbi:uncharacterized protein [Setaria viridis]|uniref:uncharacterized protein isoform X4 n=1 Tax=Setaria viridis TaxID=4556 RepID=UPI0014937CCC|nr:uncharacterized protein LOC117848077 isoform X4 [Setaria viridis]XP_034585368.1 uncharacterized protein LOC117848077 isoform X5 [Setaria viridis]XP_034585375.1 uncharacterized protein LOC117848077 isoform X5 [Setaria viridis]
MEELIDHNWKNLQVTEWTITEQLEKPIQKDSSSCGLFMLKFMEYWTGETLSHAITQVTTDFGRPPNYRKNLDVEWLAETIRSWPGISYSVSRCKTILMPIEFNGGFILIVLNKDTRTLYILDPTPLNPIYQYNPNARYVKKLLWTAEYLPKAMSKTCPGSIWNEDIFLWRQIIIPDVTVQNRELSGYLVSLFMSTWKDVELPLPVLKDGYKLRKRILGQLLIYKDNECKYNMPSGVLDFISCICNTQQ